MQMQYNYRGLFHMSGHLDAMVTNTVPFLIHMKMTLLQQLKRIIKSRKAC